jgi:hypothetical protein
MTLAPYWTDGQVTLHLGDCREVTEWLAADVLVTDPPYGRNWRQGTIRVPGRESAGRNGIAGDGTTAVRDEALAMWAGRPAVIFGDLMLAPPADTAQTMVYRKPGDAGVRGATGGFRRDAEAVYLIGPWPSALGGRSSVLDSGARQVGGSVGPAARYGHPHAKPVDVMETLIAACPPGVIADPFSGGGSTLIAARNQGRRAIGVELEERYCEAIVRRLAQADLFGAASRRLTCSEPPPSPQTSAAPAAARNLPREQDGTAEVRETRDARLFTRSEGKHYMRISIKRAIAAAAVLGPLSLGLTAVASAPAQASPAAHVSVVSEHPDATPACWFDCSNVFSEQTGQGTIMSVFVPGSNGQAITAHVGTKTDLRAGNLGSTNEDFTLSQNDTLGDACPATNQTQPDLLAYNSYACIQLREGNFTSSFPVIEDNWSPNGDQSGLCPGIPGAAVAGELVTLQSCGQNAGTLWVVDENNVHVIGGVTYSPLVLGSDPQSSQPFVLEENTGSHAPANLLQVERNSLLSHSFVPNERMFSAYNGPAL